ncbi:MAG: hypothetical protein KGL53_14170, partial [Elusimicrobia bacterium]|nr:hypothetical protein [Elusimicrobiota bacterium]
LMYAHPPVLVPLCAVSKRKHAPPPPAPPRAGRLHWAAAAALLVVFVGRLLDCARLKSPCYDEALYLVYGHSLWETGDFRLSIDKPPLVPWAAGLAPEILGASFDRSDPDWVHAADWLKAPSPWTDHLSDFRWRFFLSDLHRNKVPEARLLFWSRASLILLDALALLGAFALAVRLLGPGPALWLLFFCTMSPNLLAHAGLVGEDGTVAVMALLAVLAFAWAVEEPSPLRGAVFGAASAAALLSKHSALTLGLAFAALLPAAYALKASPRGPGSARRAWTAFAAAVAALAVLFLAAYRVVDLPYYWLSVRNTLLYQTRGQAAFFDGRISYDGFWFYYLACLVLKLSPALLVLPVVWLARRTWSAREAWLTAVFLVPAAVLTGVASADRIQLGLRYVLPVVPLLAGLAALAAAKRPWLGAVLAAVTAVSSLAAHPDYLSYFNLLAGSRPWTWLSDSNVDWGQDLWALRRYVHEHGADAVVLSYYGASVPEAVGFPFQDLYSFGVWGDKSQLGPLHPQKELLAVSATNRVGLYLTRALGGPPFRWLDAREPEAVLGGSIFVYDITSDAGAHAELSRLYAAGGRRDAAAREARRAMGIDPSGAALGAVFRVPDPSGPKVLGPH